MTTAVGQAASRELDRINTMLGLWEAQPVLTGDGWLPGDPLYERPGGACVGEQTPRPMFEVIDDNELGWWEPRCEPCAVSWAGPGPCWVCGAERLLSGQDTWVEVSPWELWLHRRRARTRRNR